MNHSRPVTQATDILLVSLISPQVVLHQLNYAGSLQRFLIYQLILLMGYIQCVVLEVRSFDMDMPFTCNWYFLVMQLLVIFPF